METERLILRKFEENDLEALYLILKDKDVNTFLPWYPINNIEETKTFYKEQIKNKEYYFAICLKSDGYPIGYIQVDTESDSHDLGYALRKEYWHKGIVSEAGNALITLLKENDIPYITATHDRENLRSGAVMQRIGMKYCYSYKEQWQPKNILVAFRMYQLNFDGKEDRVYQKYWELYDEHFIETNL